MFKPPTKYGTTCDACDWDVKNRQPVTVTCAPYKTDSVLCFVKKWQCLFCIRLKDFVIFGNHGEEQWSTHDEQHLITHFRPTITDKQPLWWLLRYVNHSKPIHKDIHLIALRPRQFFCGFLCIAFEKCQNVVALTTILWWRNGYIFALRSFIFTN